MHEEEHDEGMPFLEHLEELRHTILRSLAALGLGMVPALAFSRQILDVLKQPLVNLNVDPDTFLQLPQVMGAFKVLVAVGFWGGLFLALPFVVFFAAQFVFPGLHDHEKRVVRKCSGAAVVLFFVGACLGYFGTATHAIHALVFRLPQWMGNEPTWIYLTDYVMFILKLVIGFGLSFELPLILLGLGYAGVVDSVQLRTKRRHVFVGLLAFAMMLTPPEPISQLVMATSLYVLYEGCILLLRRHEVKEALADA